MNIENVNKIKSVLSKIESEEIRIKLRRAVKGWGRGDLDEAFELYEEFGLGVFRKLPETYWRIKKDTIQLFRAISEEELQRGPYRFAGTDMEKIQRLTSWSRNRKFVEEWAGKEKIASGRNGIVICMEAEQNDIAFFR